MEIDPTSPPLNPPHNLALDHAPSGDYPAGSSFLCGTVGALDPTDPLPRRNTNFPHPIYVPSCPQSSFGVSFPGGSTFSASEPYGSSPSTRSYFREDNDAISCSEVPGNVNDSVVSGSMHQPPVPPNPAIQSPNQTETIGAREHSYHRISAATKILFQHIQWVTRQGQLWYICQFDRCGASYPDPSFICRHMEKCHFKGVKFYECDLCHKQFVSEASARRHQACQIKRFSCAVCHKIYAREDYQRWHQKKHSS